MVETSGNLRVMQLQLLGHTWTVYLVDPDHRRLVDPNSEDPCDGCCVYKDHAIYLNNTLAESRLLDTLIHECIHAVHDTMGFTMREHHVRNLAQGLAQMLAPLWRMTNE